jgi:hypothetical protein
MELIIDMNELCQWASYGAHYEFTMSMDQLWN